MRVERYAQGRLDDGSLQQRWTATNALSLSSSIFHFAPSPLDTRDTPVTRRHIVASDRSIDRSQVSRRIEDTEESVEERARCPMINASRSSA